MRILNMLRASAVALALGLIPSLALAQSNPGLTYGQVPTPAQWNSYFAAKQDLLNFTPFNAAGGVFGGRIVTTPPSAAVAGFNLTPGTTPGSPVNGDLWVTSSGFFGQVNGATVGPFAQGTAGSFSSSQPLAVSFPGGGVVNYALNFNASLLKDGGNNLGINLANPNVWPGQQTFVAPVLGAAAGTSLALGGCTIGSSTLCVTGPSTLFGANTAPYTSSGSFTDIRDNSSVSPISIYSQIFPGVAEYDGLSSTIVLNGGTTVNGSAAVAGYVRNRNASSSGGLVGNGVALFGVLTCEVASCSGWGTNTLIQDQATRTVGSLTGITLIGYENDISVMNPGTQVTGVSVGGNSLAQPSIANAFIANSLGTGITWQNGFWCIDGAVSQNCIVAGPSTTTGTSTASTKILMQYFNGSSAKKTVTLQADTNRLTMQTDDAGLNLSIGTSGVSNGSVSLSNSSNSNSVVVFAFNPSANYNFNLPTTAGTTGAPLLSGGGAFAPMSWGSVSGTGSFALANSPTFITPSLGSAVAASINKVAITAPATSATLTIANGKTFTASNTLSFTGTDGTSFAFPGASDTVATLGATQTFSANQTFGNSVTVNGNINSNFNTITPNLIGGGLASSTLVIESTFGAGTTDSISIKTGSQVTAMQFLSNQAIVLPAVVTGTPTSSLCLDASNHIVKKTTTGSCI